MLVLFVERVLIILMVSSDATACRLLSEAVVLLL